MRTSSGRRGVTLGSRAIYLPCPEADVMSYQAHLHCGCGVLVGRDNIIKRCRGATWSVVRLRIRLAAYVLLVMSYIEKHIILILVEF